MNCFLSWFSQFSAIIVGIQIVRIVLPWLYENFIGPLLIGSKVNLKSMGNWALITGATDGIGKAYAKALAKLGINVILVSRSRSKLEDVSKEIESQYNVKVKIIDVDFTTPGSEIYDKIEAQITDLEIGILVNNVGMSYSNPEYFLAIPNSKQTVMDIVQCNINSVTNMCRIILPGMVKREKGVIINLSSLSAIIPNPLLCVYSASKAFIDKFSDDLSIEYGKNGIIIQSVLPGYVCSNMSKVKRSSWMTPSADQFVTSALSTIGISKHTTGYYPHALLKLMINGMQRYTPNTINVITGATDGIGKAYAVALAKRGINIVLVSRSKEKLEIVSSELREKYTIKTKCIDIDFTSVGLEIYDRIEREIHGLEIGILVNNVGMSGYYPEFYVSIKNLKQFISDMICCNINSLTNMSRIILPGMIERRKGLIINLSSMSSRVPTPLLTLYAATKAFISKFSTDLAIEYDEKRTGVKIQCLVPGFIVTNMTKIKKSNYIFPEADTFVESAIRSLGYGNANRSQTGYGCHAIWLVIYDFLLFVTPKTTKNLCLKVFQDRRDIIIKKIAAKKAVDLIK